MQKFVIGIDVSKKTLDLCLQNGDKIMDEWVLSNTFDDLKKSFEKLLKKHGTDILVCAEHTGMYTYPLIGACGELSVNLWLENPVQIKYCSGIKRTKSDKADARKIADYAVRFQDKARLYSISDEKMMSLRVKWSEYSLYVSQRATLLAQQKDQKHFMSSENYDSKNSRLEILIEDFNKLIAEIEKEIDELISSDPIMSHQHELLCSVDGVGDKIAVMMLLATHAFTTYKDPKQFCSYAGVAPFEYTSGSSVRGRTRVSQMADKSVKSLLYMGALSVATRMKTGDLHDYYVKKIGEGKHHLSVLNAIKAKLIHRMFAVIRDDREYERDYVWEQKDKK